MDEDSQRLGVFGGRNVRSSVLAGNRSDFRGVGCGLCGPFGCAGCPQPYGNQGSVGRVEGSRISAGVKSYHRFIERAIIALSASGVASAIGVIITSRH